jgi:hypothetical protein
MSGCLLVESTNVLWVGLFSEMGQIINVKLYCYTPTLYFSPLSVQNFQMMKGKHTKSVFDMALEQNSR